MKKAKSNELSQFQRNINSSEVGTIWTTVGRVLSAVANGANALACVLVVLMALAFGYEVISRYFFAKPTGFVNQIAAYSMPLITFLGVAWTLRKNGHVSVDILTSQLSPRPRAILAAVMDSLSVVLLVCITVFAYMTVMESYEQGTRSFATAITFPEFIPQIVMPVGLLLLLLEQIRLAAIGWRQILRGEIPEMADEAAEARNLDQAVRSHP